MKIKAVSLLVLMLVSLTACSQTDYVQGDYSNTKWVNVYYESTEPSNGEEFIRAERCEIPEGSLEQTISAIYSQACREPISNSLKSAIPENTTLNSVKISDGTVTLDLSGEYESNLSFARTVADYCLTMSLCELEEVSAVTILVNGAPPTGRVSEKLTPDGIVLADLNLTGFRKKLKLYFPDTTYDTLGLELRDTVFSGEEEEVAVVIKNLAEGPSQLGLLAALPYGTSLKSVVVSDEVCKLDFSAEFIKNPLPSEKAERMCIRAILKTLEEIQGIEKVQILVDGEKTKGFKYFDISRPFTVGDV